MQNQDEPIVVQTMVITVDTGKLLTTSVRSAYSTAKSRATAYDAAYAEGVRAEMVVKGDPIRDQVKAFMLAGMPASERNLLDSKKEDYTEQEWDVKKVLKSSAAKDLGGLVSKFKKAMERRAPVAPATTESETETETNAESEVEPEVDITPYQAMATAVGKFVENVQEAENSPNVVNICETGAAFITSLTDLEPEVEPEAS